MNRIMILWCVASISLCLYVISNMTGFPCYYIVTAYRDYQYSRSNYVVSTELYDENGLIHVIDGDANIKSDTGEFGPYRKVVVFRDGSRVNFDGDQYSTWGSEMQFKK